MATTPPAQIQDRPGTPPTPLHGSAYHSSPRYPRRTKDVPASADSSFASTSASALSRTPKSPRTSRASKTQTDSSSIQNLHSGTTSTPKRTSTRHVQILSPSSPAHDARLEDPFMEPQAQPPTYLSSSAILQAHMLPTPVKTPAKVEKHSIQQPNMTARALFQEHLKQDPAVISSPRKQKARRYNGFTMEDAAAGSDEVQIFVDSADKVPETDSSKENPFTEAEVRSRGQKRKRESSGTPTVNPVKKTKTMHKSAKPKTRQLDPQVREAINRDEGMVYVFRGKKVYRRFDDTAEEEEVIDPSELEFARNSPSNPRNTFKTLSRKSIKPQKLFQAEIAAQKRARGQDVEEDEAETEIEDNGNKTADEYEGVEILSPSRSTRSKVTISKEGELKKRVSPFDGWQRLKSGSRSVTRSGEAGTPAGAKRRSARGAMDTMT